MNGIQRLTTLVKARTPAILVVGHEEERYLDLLHGMGVPVLYWTMSLGLGAWHATDQGDTILRQPPEEAPPKPVQTPVPLAPVDVLKHIISPRAPQGIYVVCDFVRLTASNPPLIRMLRDAIQHLRRHPGRILVITSTTEVVPPELEKEIATVHMPLPDSRLVSDHLARVMKRVALERPDMVGDGFDRNAVEAALSGLTLNEMDNALAASIAGNETISADAVLEEKKAQLVANGLLEIADIPEEITGLASAGGLEYLKDWLAVRRPVFLHDGSSHAVIDVRQHRIPVPKGILLLGVQGCGKSHFVRCLAREWGLPLVNLSMSRIFASLVGQSEQQMRQALEIVDTMAPVILFVDELEKAFGGVASSSTTDGGTTARVTGTFLSWMQDRTSRVFVTGTANDIASLPLELVRKGRFDEVFFVGLPHARERAAIIDIHLAQHGLDALVGQCPALVEATEGYSGAEIAQLVIDTLYEHFSSQQPVDEASLIVRARETKPLSETRSQAIEALTEWAEGRTVSASRSHHDASVIRFAPPGGRQT